MCITFTIPIVIMAIGLLLSWWKGHRNRTQVAALCITLIGAIVLISISLIPIVYDIAYGIPPTICLTIFIPFFVLAFQGIMVAFSYDKQNRSGVVMVETRRSLLACGSAFLLLSSIFFAGIIFIPSGTEKFSYHISIKPSSDGNYIVYLPAPIGGDGDYSDCARQLKVEKGSANFSYKDTEEGKTLIVRAKGAVWLGMSANHAYYRNGESTLSDVHLSLYDKSGSGNQRIFRAGLDPFSDVENVTLRLTMEVSNDATFDGGGYLSGTGSSTFDKGWHTMNMTMHGANYD